MPGFDVDGDGDGDVVTGLAAHQWGLSWFERQGTGTAITFVPHAILPSAAGANNISQLHSLAVADVNGDGAAGHRRRQALLRAPVDQPRSGDDRCARDSLVRAAARRGRRARPSSSASFTTPAALAGNFVARDLTGDGKVDIFTTNKRGTFLHVQQ